MLSPDQYRIEKSRIAITLRLQGGEHVRGYIFLQPSAYLHLGREEPLDLFNSPEPFFPVETEDGEVRLVAKDRVVEVEGIPATSDDDFRRASARDVTLTLTLADGVVRTGCAYLEMPSDRPRLLDFLNTMTQRFFPLYVGEDIHLVNARAIEHVRPRD